VPTYEYACKGKCGEHFEVYQAFTDAPLTTCPTCGGKVRKVFGNIGISFKGSGFYRTDSRSSGGPKTEKKVEKAEKSETTTTEAKKDTKAETKSETKKSDSSTAAAAAS
jgi:putative FmdB family regulatory protein